jgi:dynein heavy chain
VIDFVESIRNYPDKLDFVYAKLACGPFESINPFDLEIIPFTSINQSNYYTVSVKGITHFRNGEVIFTSLEEWMRER